MTTNPNEFKTTLSKLDKNLRMLHSARQDIYSIIRYSNPMCMNVDNLINLISTGKIYDYYAKLDKSETPKLNTTTDKLESLDVYFGMLKAQLISNLNDLQLIDDIDFIDEDELYEEVKILNNGQWWGYNKLPLIVTRVLYYNAMVKFTNTSSASTDVNFDTHLFRQIFADCVPYTFSSSCTVHQLELKYADIQKKILDVSSHLNNDTRNNKGLTTHDEIVYNLGVICLYWAVNKLTHTNGYGLEEIDNLFVDYYKDMDASMLGKELTNLINKKNKYLCALMLLDAVKFEKSMELSPRPNDDDLIDNTLDYADNCISKPREYEREMYDYMSSAIDNEI